MNEEKTLCREEMNAIYGITVELDRTARASRVNRQSPPARSQRAGAESGQTPESRGGAASVKRSRPDNVKSSGYPQLPI